MSKKIFALLALAIITSLSVVSCSQTETARALNKIERTISKVEALAKAYMNEDTPHKAKREYIAEVNQIALYSIDAVATWKKVRAKATTSDIKRYNELKNRAKHAVSIFIAANEKHIL